ncbi:putative alpha-1,6-mannanase (GH76 family) [Arthrobacter sp. V1I7]|uniref:glycoside hydrolase family 76 protein n=1 Tax=Arthrobacter sp. V1I7 TaxID=3042274 RepID=UPI00278A34AB|nr:glycoside hydrolase family 76 protein [Arthrobacter sp. V1I7]MDQ0822831.1 putative alpha-1,6-mannanase (GH76 family) [Arthrobacter sp. V1I7]
MTPADAAAPNWSFRADEAARSVTRLFGQRLFFLPGTHVAAVVRPSGRLKNLVGPWHYWWQAQYLDCLVDTGRRELGYGGRPGARFDGENRASAGQLASRLVAGIRLRNFFTFVNDYFDDMAWLALATRRLEDLAGDARNPAGRRRNARALKSLTLQFDSASTDDLGGGTFWSKKRDFKNTPATAPVALHYARSGNPAKAQALLDWLDARLYDPAQGLYQDGLRISGAGEVVLEGVIYTYNQGPVLGALLELGGAANLERASSLVASVARSLTLPAPLLGRAAAVLRCEGNGDGGLFTGILVRYLALAAVDGRLPAETRATAAVLVNDTAEAFWEGRRILSAEDPLAHRGSRLIFSARPELPARRSYPPGTAVELCTQLQAWMVLEAAAAIAGRTEVRAAGDTPGAGADAAPAGGDTPAAGAEAEPVAAPGAEAPSESSRTN